MKRILFGIALILFGQGCLYACTLSGWGIGQIAGVIIGVLGLIFSVTGFLEKET